MSEQNEGQKPGVNYPERGLSQDRASTSPEDGGLQTPTIAERKMGAFGTGRVVEVVDMSERDVPIPVGRETPQMLANGLNSPYELDALGRLAPRAPRR